MQLPGSGETGQVRAQRVPMRAPPCTCPPAMGRIDASAETLLLPLTAAHACSWRRLNCLPCAVCMSPAQDSGTSQAESCLGIAGCVCTETPVPWPRWGGGGAGARPGRAPAGGRGGAPPPPPIPRVFLAVVLGPAPLSALPAPARCGLEGGRAPLWAVFSALQGGASVKPP